MALRPLGGAPRSQAAARALAVALLALGGAVRPAGAARMFGDQGQGAIQSGSESEAGAAVAAAGAATACASKMVTDGAKCGFDSVKNWVEDATACGWSQCSRGRFKFPCPKRCEQTESRARTCEIKGECGYVVRVHLKGHLYVGTYDNMTISLDYADHELIEGSPEVRMIINAEKNGNGDRVSNMIKGTVEKAKVDANEKLKSFKDSFKQTAAHKVSDAMDTQAIEHDAGTNHSEAAQALADTITSLMGAAEIEFYREEIDAKDENYWGGVTPRPREAKCDRSLIIEYDNKDRKGRKANKITWETWPTEPIAQKRIPKYNCVKTYVANCKTLELEIKTTCKEDAPIEERRCIGGFGCLKASEKIPIWDRDGEVLDLFLPDGPVQLLSGAAFIDTKRKEVEKDYGNMTAFVTIPGFTDDFSMRLCTSIVKRKWWIVGWPAQEVARRTCAGAVGMFLDASFERRRNLPTPQDMDTHGLTPSMVAKFFGSNLTVHVRTVPWQGLQEYLQQTLVNHGKDMKPAKLIRSNVALVGAGHKLLLDGTWIDVQGSVDVGR